MQRPRQMLDLQRAERIVEAGGDEADEIRALVGEAARKIVHPVAEFLGRLVDLLARLRRNAGIRREGARNGGARDARHARHVERRDLARSLDPCLPSLSSPVSRPHQIRQIRADAEHRKLHDIRRMAGRLLVPEHDLPAFVEGPLHQFGRHEILRPLACPLPAEMQDIGAGLVAERMRIVADADQDRERDSRSPRREARAPAPYRTSRGRRSAGSFRRRCCQQRRPVPGALSSM